MRSTLVLGSGPNVTVSREWPRAPFDHILAINNAWAVRPDWDELICPDDFPDARLPTELSPLQMITRSNQYVPSQNTFGGFVYAGGTMAFTACYWALAAHRPRVIATMGCDMVYSGKATHFYGKGTADPLRQDKTLRNLEAKSARLRILAAMRGCAMVNLSQDESRLAFPRATPDAVKDCTPQPYDHTLARAALQKEEQVGYYVPSGKYWKEEDRFDEAILDELDALWLKAAQYP